MEYVGAMDDDIVRFLLELNDSVRNLLDERFVGSYLHGSLTMAAFQPTEGDIDVIVTEDCSLKDTIRDDLRHTARSLLLPASASGLDLGVLSTDVALDMTEDACWEASIQV